jgi:hypothetical protein
LKAVLIKRLIEIDEAEEVAQGRKHAFANMVSNFFVRNQYVRPETPKMPTYLGKISASNTTVLMPSRASAAAEYEPAGPPPTTRTVHSSGIDIVL